ncbi:hypothetical protein [Streptomyces tendae]|uniref:hypothetical protein n=1 Tax=Streptomyces tendae TaxID=1932 RepID=UPI00342BAE3F
MTGRHTVDSITSDALDQLYAEIDRLTAELGDYDQRVEEQQAAIARVRAIHREWDADPGHCAHCQDGMGTPLPWPCPTTRALGEQPAPAPAATQAGDDRVLHFDHRLSESEVEEIKARWRERYGHRFTALPVDPEAERAATERAVKAAAECETGTSCTCGGRFPLQHLHADQHQPKEQR